MSFYITLLSDQAQGTGQKFTARLPRSYYLVEDDWEVALVHMSHPGFNQPLEDQTKQNWTQEDSQKHWMKTDVRYMPKREGWHGAPESHETNLFTARVLPHVERSLDCHCVRNGKTTHGSHDGYSQNGRGRFSQTTTTSRA